MFGDSVFNIGVLDEAEKRKGPTYLYYYNYNKTFSFCPLVLFATPTPNVGEFIKLKLHFGSVINKNIIIKYQ